MISIYYVWGSLLIILHIEVTTHNIKVLMLHAAACKFPNTKCLIILISFEYQFSGRTISVSCDTQNAQKLPQPRVRRDLANKTVISDLHGEKNSNSTLDVAANISVADKETHEHSILSTIPTPESQSTSSDPKSESNTQNNIGDIKSTEITILTNYTRESENVDKGLKSRNITITPTPNSPVIELNKQTENTENTESLTTKGESIEIITSSNDIGEPGNVDENSHNITMAPTPNSFVAEVTKQAIDTENTEPLTIEMKEALTTEMKEALTTEMKEALTTEMEADEGHFNIESTTIAFSNPTINGSELHKDTVDIEPIDQLPTEQDAPNIVDELEGNEYILENSITKANFTESIKYRPTTTTYDKQAALDNTTTKMQVERGKVGENSHLLTSSVEKSVVKDDYVVGKRTALSSGKDTIVNLKDENIESNTTSLIDLFVNNTSDFSTTLMTINPTSTKPEPEVKTTIRDTNTVVSTSDTDLKTSLDKTNKSTEPTSQSVTSNMKSEMPYHKPEVTTANTSVIKTDVTTRISVVVTKKTAEAVTEENDRKTGSKPLAPTTENGRGATDRVDNVVKPGKANILHENCVKLPTCVRPGRKPKLLVFSCEGSIFSPSSALFQAANRCMNGLSLLCSECLIKVLLLQRNSV